MTDLPETLEQVTSRLEALEKRVHRLEQEANIAAPSVGLSRDIARVQPDIEQKSIEPARGVFSILGKSMLGIAGAYLLRALAESGALPRSIVAAVAIAYAIAWLVMASKASPKTRIAPVIYSLTSALILAPMLWELTMRFSVLPPAVSAAALAIFISAATTLTWRHNYAPDFGIAFASAALTALGLSIATHVMPSFLTLLLLMVVICEVRGRTHSGGGVRLVVVIVADFMVWALIFVYRSPVNTRLDYPALGLLTQVTPAILLFLISLTSVTIKTIFEGRDISALETAQAVAGFLLALSSLLFLLPEGSARTVGLVCAVLAAGCYAAAWGRFRSSPNLRNFYVFSTWSAGLFLAAIFLILPSGWMVAGLIVGTIVSSLAAWRLCCTTLESHGVVYLILSAYAGGLWAYIFDALAGSIPNRVGGGVLLVAACSSFCLIATREREGEGWHLQLLHLIPAALAACAISALIAGGMVKMIALRINPETFHIAFLRTLTICILAFAFAWIGSKWRKHEMVRVAYAGLVLTAVKLLFEDIRHGHVGFIAASIFVFALTLLGVPRLARTERRLNPS